MLNWGHYLSLQKTFVKVPCRHTQFIDFSPKMSYNNLNRRLYVTRGQKLEKCPSHKRLSARQRKFHRREVRVPCLVMK